MGFAETINETYRDPQVVAREKEEEKRNSPFRRVCETGFEMVMSIQNARETAMLINANATENANKAAKLDQLKNKKAKAQARMEKQKEELEKQGIDVNAEDFHINIDEESYNDMQYDFE